MKKFLWAAVSIIFIFVGCSEDDSNPSGNNSNTINWNVSQSNTINGQTTEINVDAEFNVNGNNLSGSGTVIYNDTGLIDTVSTSFSGSKTSEEISIDGNDPDGEDFFSYSGEKGTNDFGDVEYIGTITVYAVFDTLTFTEVGFPY